MTDTKFSTASSSNEEEDEDENQSQNHHSEILSTDYGCDSNVFNLQN